MMIRSPVIHSETFSLIFWHIGFSALVGIFNDLFFLVFVPYLYYFSLIFCKRFHNIKNFSSIF